MRTAPQKLVFTVYQLSPHVFPLSVRVDQFTLCSSLHAFDSQFSPQRGRLIRHGLLINKLYGPPPSRVFSSGPGVVLFYPRGDIFGDAGVQAIIYALNDINVPHDYRSCLGEGNHAARNIPFGR